MRLKLREALVVPADGEEKWSSANRAQFEPWFYCKNQITNPFLSLKDVAKVDLKAIYRWMRQAEKARVESSSREAEEEPGQVGDEQEEEVRDDGNENVGNENIGVSIRDNRHILRG
jgi:hypothetical protein